MSTHATNAQVAALLRTLNVSPTSGNIIQFQTVLGNVSSCADNISFAYQIDDSSTAPNTALLGGSTTKSGTYDMSISVTDYKGQQYTQIFSFTDSFSLETGLAWSGAGVYDVNISITNQAEASCGPYCSIQTGVPPSLKQNILALTTSCV